MAADWRSIVSDSAESESPACDSFETDRRIHWQIAGAAKEALNRKMKRHGHDKKKDTRID